MAELHICKVETKFRPLRGAVYKADTPISPLRGAISFIIQGLCKVDTPIDIPCLGYSIGRLSVVRVICKIGTQVSVLYFNS